MKRLLTIALLFSIYSIGFSQSKQDLEKLKTFMKDEKKVKDYVLTDAKVLYVSVSDDGTNRNGLASYFCESMKELKIDVERVKIVQFGSKDSPKRDNAYGIKLGESWCK